MILMIAAKFFILLIIFVEMSPIFKPSSDDDVIDFNEYLDQLNKK